MGLGLFGWVPGLVGGFAVGILDWFLWRAGGPAHRWRAFLV